MVHCWLVHHLARDQTRTQSVIDTISGTHRGNSRSFLRRTGEPLAQSAPGSKASSTLAWNVGRSR
jgi:hypothetical protein